MPAAPIKLGDGLLTIGEVGTEIDASCLVNGARITWSKDEDDAVTKLCGDVAAGAVTYTASLTGNLDVDIDDPAGLFALSQSAKGSQVPFVFTPNTAAETSAAGTLTLDPLDFGADEYGADLNSDFEFTIIGDPVFTYPTVPLMARTAKRGKAKD